MFWQKLQHHFFFFFFSFVLLAQSLIFVVSQAVPFKNYELKSDWLSLQNGQTLAVGQNIDLQVNIDVEDKKIGAIYFVISDTSKNFVINFETQKNNANIYASLASWHTADWPSGVYSLNVQASIVDDQGQVVTVQESAPIWVKLIPLEEYSRLMENTIPTAISDSAVSIPSDGDGSFDIDNLTPINLSDDVIIDHNNTATSTATSTPDTSATSTVALVPDLELVAPENTSTITSRNFLLNFVTNFSSDLVSYEFINTDNAAISTQSLTIEKTDGYNWVKNIELGDSLINGSYKLIISAAIPESNLVVNKTFDYMLYTPSLIKPEDLFMHVVNLSSNLQGSIGLRAEANLKIDNLDFVIEDSISHLEALRIKGVNVTEDGEGAIFTALWDTAVLANGNYFIYVESKIDQQKVGNIKQLVSIFNSKNGEQATTTLEGFAEEVPSGPGVVNVPTSTVSVANQLTPNAESSIDCQRSGISDAILCQKYQAEINDSLSQICIDKNIFVGTDCEKYIFENESNSCLDNKIEDPAKCREYLYQKYSVNLSCSITATSTCQQVISDKYIARLAYEYEQKNKFLSAIKDVNIEGLTLNLLRDKLAVANLGASNLSLLASDKKISIFNIKNKSYLDNLENLYVSPPIFIMGDGDNDGLPDDLESYYQTDANKADTDADGHNDGQEILNNYNPLGDGKLNQERTALDQALLSKLALEEPRTSILVPDNNWEISSANSADGSMKLSGKALANTWVNIFIYSGVPLLATTKADINGDWSYSINDPLTEGVHQAYIASNDKNGKILVQSAPLTFVLSNVKNESAPIDIDQQISVIIDQGPNRNWTIYYIIGGSLLLLVLLALLVLFLKRRRQQPDGLVSQAQDVATVTPSPVTINTTKEIKLNLPDAPVLPIAEEPPVPVENKD
jgi:hypothetical protein